MDPLSRILMDTARDLMLAQMAGKSLAPVEAEAAARISAHYQPKACPDCLAANGGYRDTELCAGCYADRYAESPDESDHGDEA